MGCCILGSEARPEQLDRAVSTSSVLRLRSRSHHLLSSPGTVAVDD